METIDFNYLVENGQPLIIIIVTLILVIINFFVFGRIEKDKSWPGPVKYILAIIIVTGGLMLFITSLNISNSEQILKYLTLIVTAGITLSSTSVLGNLIAGIVNNSMKRFKKGDFVIIDDQYQGIVTELNAFNIAVQTDDSNFITVPNLHIIRNPIKRIRKTNIHIDTTVSLGYDVSKEEIKEALKLAAESTGLKEPFVRIIELGDFSILYKILGLWDDNTELNKMRSILNEKVIEELHQRKIEIVSPSFINHRRNGRGQKFIPNPDIISQTKINVPREPPIFDVGKITKQIQDLKDEKNQLESKIKEKNIANEVYILNLLKEKVVACEKKILGLEKELEKLESTN